MSDRASSSSFTRLRSELEASGSRHHDWALGANFPDQFVDISNSTSTTRFASQTKQASRYDTGFRGSPYSELTGHLSANAEGAQYAARNLQKGINQYRASQKTGKKDTAGGLRAVRSRASGAFAGSIPDTQILRAGSALVNHNGATFGIVGTGGTVKKPSTSTRPRPRPAASLSRNPAWGYVGEDGDMKPPSTTTKPKSGHY